MTNAITAYDLLSSHKLDISFEDSKGNTMLHHIAAQTYTQKTPEEIQMLEEIDAQNLKLMLKCNSDVNIKNKEGYTCVHLAIKNKRSDALVKVFLDHGGDCDYNSTDEKGCTALYHAVSPVSYTFAGNSSKYLNFNFKFRDNSLIKQLVQQGAKIDTVANNGYSPLLFAVVMKRTEYVKVMVEKSLSADGLENTIKTYAYSCRGENYSNVVNHHYSHKSNNNIYPPKHYYGMTPLQVAVCDCNKDMAQLLVKAGAYVNVVNGKGEHALHMIIKGEVSPERSCTATEEETQIAKLLINSGINLNAKDKSSEMALQLAIRHDKQDIVTHILEKGLAAL